MRTIRTPTVAIILACCGAAGMALASVSDIIQAHQKFSQSNASLKVGDVLHFLNHDDVTHNIMVVDKDLNAADQGLQKPNETITVKFDHAGDFQVRCAIHPTMKLTVTVR